MNKLKKFLLENKVLLFLAIILIVWLAIFMVIIIVFFYGTSDSVYGSRLDSIKDVPVSENLKSDVINTLETDDLINKVSINVKGKIIYINVECEDGIKVDNAKKVAESSITLFSESILKVYDIEFIVKINSSDDEKSYTLIGTKNSNGSDGVVWREYSLEESSAQ